MVGRSYLLRHRFRGVFIACLCISASCAGLSGAFAQTAAEVQTIAKSSYLELYVNSKDSKHFTTVIDHVLRLQQRSLLPISALYHIGDHNNVTPEMRARLWQGRIRIYALSRVPSDLPLKVSPAWIFITPNGRRIVEGTLAIEHFIAPSGEFRDGSSIRDSVNPTSPESGEKMEDF